jgi:hypothetical protein
VATSIELPFDSLAQLLSSLTHLLGRIQATGFLQLLRFAQHRVNPFPCGFELAPCAFILRQRRRNRNERNHEQQCDPPLQTTQRPWSSLPLIHRFSSTF